MVLFIKDVVLTVKFVDKIPRCDLSNELALSNTLTW